MIYQWLVLRRSKWGKKGAIIEVEMKVAEYDGFKAAHPELQRYFGTVPALGKFGVGGAKLTNQFKDRMKAIRDNYPGAKGMLKDSKFNWGSEH